MKRLCRLYNRRETTRWSKKELDALKYIEPVDEEDLRTIERYYGAKIPPDKDYRRRDLQTLINNWNGEVDRAKKFKAPSIL